MSKGASETEMLSLLNATTQNTPISMSMDQISPQLQVCSCGNDHDHVHDHQVHVYAVHDINGEQTQEQSTDKTVEISEKLIDDCESADKSVWRTRDYVYTTLIVLTTIAGTLLFHKFVLPFAVAAKFIGAPVVKYVAGKGIIQHVLRTAAAKCCCCSCGGCCTGGCCPCGDACCCGCGC